MALVATVTMGRGFKIKIQGTGVAHFGSGTSLKYLETLPHCC